MPGSEYHSVFQLEDVHVAQKILPEQSNIPVYADPDTQSLHHDTACFDGLSRYNLARNCPARG